MREHVNRKLKAILEARLICAWCGKYISGEPSGQATSHGICDSCAKKWKADSQRLHKERGISDKQKPVSETLLHEIISLIPPISGGMPSFDPVNPKFFSALCAALTVWTKRAPQFPVEHAVEALHELFLLNFHMQESEAKPPGMWHQVWGTHAQVEDFIIDVQIHKSAHGTYAVRVESLHTDLDVAVKEEQIVWYY